MREAHITLPELMLVAGTRAALGAGLGLLLADRLADDQRRAVGWTLFLVGALSTVPLAFEVFGGNRLAASEKWQEQTGSGSLSEAAEQLRQRGCVRPDLT